MTLIRRLAAASALAFVATLAVGAPASASSLGHDHSMYGGGDEHHSVVDVSENNVGPVQACNNNVPTNVLGVQVPVSDLAGVLGFDQQGNAASTVKTCDQDSMQDN